MSSLVFLANVWNADGIDSCYTGMHQAMPWATSEATPRCPRQHVLTRHNHRNGAKPKHAKKGAPEQSLIELIHASEKHVLGKEQSAHTFEVSFDNIGR